MRQNTPPVSSQFSRRLLMLRGAALLGVPLMACGGGGGGGGVGGVGSDGPPGGGGGGGGGGSAPSGSLVYRNSGVAAVYNFATRTELQFDPGTAPFINPGMAVSPGKVITSAMQGDENVYFDVGLFGLDGRRTTLLRLRRELCTQTGAAVLNADGSRLALSVDEETSASDSRRISKILVLALPSGDVVATINRYAEPIWLGTSGELLVRDAESQAMYVVGADLRSVTRLADLVSSTMTGAYSATADGRTIVYQGAVSNSTIRAYDRSNGSGWVAATDRLSDLKSPVVSPDGRYMAVLSRDLLVTRPHIVNFGVNVTVAVEDRDALANTLAECRGRMGWST